MCDREPAGAARGVYCLLVGGCGGVRGARADDEMVCVRSALPVPGECA